MKTQLRLTQELLLQMRSDLRRPHPFSEERVGFLYCRFGSSALVDILIIGYRYQAVPDDYYIDDSRYGAVIGEEAFRSTLQYLHDVPVGVLHVHLHDLDGIPRPSSADLKETKIFVPDFFHGRNTVPHGALILSADNLSGRVWLGEFKQPISISSTKIVGPQLTFLGDRL